MLDMSVAVAAHRRGADVLARGRAAESGHGEYFALLLFSILGMAVFVSAQNLVTLFLGIELLSIPLYILCASETRREGSLESGLKYLVSVGRVGDARVRARADLRRDRVDRLRVDRRGAGPANKSRAACSGTRWCSPASG